MTTDKSVDISGSEKEKHHQANQSRIEDASHHSEEELGEDPDKFIFDADSDDVSDDDDDDDDDDSGSDIPGRTPSLGAISGTPLKAILAPRILSISDREGPGRLTNLGEYFRVFQGTTEGLHRLHVDAERVHKDVSIKSLGYTYTFKKTDADPMQQVIGILTDFDMYEEEEIEEFRRKKLLELENSKSSEQVEKPVENSSAGS